MHRSPFQLKQQIYSKVLVFFNVSKICRFIIIAFVHFIVMYCKQVKFPLIDLSAATCLSKIYLHARANSNKAIKIL